MTNLFTLVKQSNKVIEAVNIIVENQSALQSEVPRHFDEWKKWECRVSTYKPSKDNGYCQISMNSPLINKLADVGVDTSSLKTGTKYMVLHKLVALAYHGENNEDDVSHLCLNPRCSNVDHLVWEPSVVNQARKNCSRWRILPMSNTLLDVCPHEPKCIDKSIFDRDDWGSLLENVIETITL